MSEQAWVTSELSTAATSPVVRQTAEFLRRYEPFDRMIKHHLEYLAKNLRLGFYPKGTVVIEPGHGVGQTLYIVKQGRVQADTGRALPASELRAQMPGDCFPIGPLLARRPITVRQRAVENTFCYELDSYHFEHLLRQKAAFYDFCARRVCNLLQEVLQGMPSNDRPVESARRSRSAHPTSRSPLPRETV